MTNPSQYIGGGIKRARGLMLAYAPVLEGALTAWKDWKLIQATSGLPSLIYFHWLYPYNKHLVESIFNVVPSLTPWKRNEYTYLWVQQVHIELFEILNLLPYWGKKFSPNLGSGSVIN